MPIGKLLSEVMLPAASAVAGGLLIAMALMAAFAAVGRMLLLARRIGALRVQRAHGHAHRARPATSGAGVVAG